METNIIAFLFFIILEIVILQGLFIYLLRAIRRLPATRFNVLIN